MAIIIIGITLIILDTQKTFSERGHFRIEELMKNKKLLSGSLIGLLSGFSYGLGNILRKVAVNYYPNTLIGAAIGSIIALFFTIVLLCFVF
jgi:drug/metabolite transporter (DMT)-like permease